MKKVNKSCLAQQMTKKIAVKVDAKIRFGIMIRTKDPFNSSNREFMTNISFWFYT